MIKIIILSILLLAIAIAGIGIKILVKKGGTFAGTCSSNNPLLHDEAGRCSTCGAKPVEQCEKDEKPTPALPGEK